MPISDYLYSSFVYLKKSIGKAVFHDSIMLTGWDTLYLQINHPHAKSHYAIGHLEGLLTYRKIEYFFKQYILEHNFNIKNFDLHKIENYPTMSLVLKLLKRLN